MKKLMTVLEIKHFDAQGKLLWEQKNIPNLIHHAAEQYFLSILFSSTEASVPLNYYCGLDNRVSPDASDTLANLSQEPTQFAYARQAVSSTTGFTIGLNTDDIYQATSNVLTFNASGGSWGPVKNVFLATTVNNSGVLLSTAALDGSRFLNDGESTTLRLGLTLRDASNAVFV